MPFMHEYAADRARPGVQVLVAAPDREVRIVIVKRQRRVADGMRKIESRDRADAMGRRADSLDVERLPRAKLNPRPEHEGNGRPMLLETFLDGRGRDEILARN